MSFTESMQCKRSSFVLGGERWGLDAVIKESSQVQHPIIVQVVSGEYMKQGKTHVDILYHIHQATFY